MNNKQRKRTQRHRKIRAKIKGTAECPRLSVFRSNQYLYLQLIDDIIGKTIVAFDNSKEKGQKGSKVEAAKKLGQLIAKEAITKKIEKVVFDRGGYRYHGRVKAAAEGAREAGLKF